MSLVLALLPAHAAEAVRPLDPGKRNERFSPSGNAPSGKIGTGVNPKFSPRSATAPVIEKRRAPIDSTRASVPRRPATEEHTPTRNAPAEQPAGAFAPATRSAGDPATEGWINRFLGEPRKVAPRTPSPANAARAGGEPAVQRK